MFSELFTWNVVVYDRIENQTLWFPKFKQSWKSLERTYYELNVLEFHTNGNKNPIEFRNT